MTLARERVVRPLPALRHPEDVELFAAETERVLEAVSTVTSSGEFLPMGWHEDLEGWRGVLRGWAVRATTRRRRFVPQEGRTPLVATDRFSNGYFHWVTETLPRLWWLRDVLGRYELVLPAFTSRFPYMMESLALFPDLLVRIADGKSRWWLEGALRVPPLALTGNYRPRLMTEVGEAWRRRVAARPPFRKLYISRSKAARRRIVNEAALTAHLESQGFETVHLEGMPFPEQVRVLAETTHVLSNHGAGLTNVLFMVPGTRVTEIRLRGDAHNNCYFSLARAMGLEYDYRLAEPAGPGEVHSVDLRVDLGRWE